MIAVMIAAALVSAQAPPVQAPSVHPQSLPEWMAGSWTTMGTADEWTEEWWTPPRAGIMLGASRGGKADALGAFEHMRIIRTGGAIAFCAMPGGKAGACFRAVSATASSITFENAQHDYPTRVEYRREGDHLLGEISGPGGSRRQTWKYKRLN